MRVLRLAWLSLVRRPTSTAMAVLALGLALGLGGMLLGLIDRVVHGIGRHEPGIDYVLGPKSSGLSVLLDAMHWSGREQDVIGFRLVSTIREEIDPPVLIPFAHFAEMVTQSAVTPIVATSREFYQPRPGARIPTLEEGRWFYPVAAEAVVGAGAARRHRLRVGDEIEARSILALDDGTPVWDRSLQIVGILHPSELPRDRVILTDLTHAFQSNAAAVHAGLMREFVERGRGVTSIWIGVDAERQEQHQQIHELLHVASGAQVVRLQHEIEQLRRLLGQGRQAALGLTALLILVAGAIIAIVLSERFEMTKRELGVLRALGLQRRSVAAVVVIEAWLIGVLGIACGAALERIGSLAVGWFWNPPWLLAGAWPSAALLTLWFCTLLAVTLAALLPLLRLYRWDAHEALAGM